MEKIIFIQPAFAHYRYELFDLIHKNHDVTFIFLRKKRTYPSSQGPNQDWNMIYLNGKEKDKFWTLRLLKLLFKKKPDIIITSINGSTQTIVAMIAGFFLKKPVILWSLSWAHPHLIKQRPYLKRLYRGLRSKWTVRSACALVVSGARSYKYNEKLTKPGTPIFKAYQSTKDFSLITSQGIPDDLKDYMDFAVRILYFSRIVDWKGLDVLIKAFSEVEKKQESVFLTIAGDGPHYEYCYSLARKLQIQNIEFCGAVKNEQAWHYYYKADIFVLPNSGKTQVEAWGLVINEATSMGLPIITTNLTGAVDDLVIDGLNGYVVKAGSITEMRDAIESLVLDKSKRKRMGKESRKLFEMVNNYERMYRGFNYAIKAVLEKK